MYDLNRITFFRENTVNRVFWVDCARFVAITLVVLTHAHEQSNVNNEFVKSILYCIDRIGVPIFFMLSGGLILPKAHTVPVLSFYRKRLPQFFILLILYSVLTNTVSGFMNGGSLLVSFTSAINNYNGIYPAGYGFAAQMWFMYSIIQLYLVAPFISRLLVNLKTSEILIFLSVCIIFNFIRHTIPALGIDWRMLGRMGNDFTGSYMSYFIAGYLLMNRGVDEWRVMKSKIFNTIVLLAPMAAVVMYDSRAGKIINNLHWYSSSLFLFISSIGAILLIKNVSEGRSNKLISAIGLYSFGIYLVHFVFIGVFKSITRLYEMNWAWSTLTLFALTLLFSVIYTHFMFKGKKTKYFVS